MENDRAFADNLMTGAGDPQKDVESEKALLSLCMRHEKALMEAVGKRLTADDFSDPRNALIFKAMSELFLQNSKVDRITTGEMLAKMGNLNRAGDYTYLYEVSDTVAVIANLEEYIKIIREKSRVRAISKELTSLQGKVLGGTVTSGEVIDMAVSNLSMMRSPDDSEEGFESSDKIIKKVLENIHENASGKGANAGIKSGFRILDMMTGGFRPGTLTVLAARPGMGKSALAINIATNVARNNIPVAIFSLEMSKVEIGNRILSSMAGVNSRNIQQGKLSDRESEKIKKSANDIAGMRLYIDDNSQVTPAKMSAKLKELDAAGNLGLIILDYLQLMTMPGRQESRQNEISAISRNLKVMAKEMKVPIIALSQLSRAAGQREDHTPQLTDLRDSGAIEQDADMVIFIDRPDYYKKSDVGDGEEEQVDLPQKDAYIYLSKNRQGEVGRVKVKWWAERTLFYEERKDDPVDPASSGVMKESSFRRTVSPNAASADYSFEDPVPADIPEPTEAPPAGNDANDEFFDNANMDFPDGFMS